MNFSKKFRITVLLLLLTAAAWCFGAAVWLFQWQISLSLLFAATLMIMAMYGYFRPAAWIPLLIAEVSVFLFYISLTPEKVFAGVKWRRECAKIPAVSYLPDGKIKISNIRNFKYRSVSDFDADYLEKIYDPDSISSLDVALSHWDDMEFVAHTLFCFNFNDGSQLAFSLEPRLPEGVSGGDFFLGIYKRYAQYLLLAVPEDIFDLRVYYRGEAFYRYRTTASPELCKKLFLKIVKKADSLDRKTEFYNSINHNCTTGIFNLVADDIPMLSGDIRLLINGFSDKMLFDKGFLCHKPGESFGSLRSRSFVRPLEKR